jgi:hypothetical protein
MPSLTTLAHGTIPLDEERARRADCTELPADRRDDGVEASVRVVGEPRAPLPSSLGLRGIRLDDDHLPARELEGPRVDPGEPELEHAARAGAEQLEDPRVADAARAGGRRCTR